jgi:RimJ/RimL family protein N-acetyltransferase
MPLNDLAIPVFETERLILRGFRESDFEALYAVVTDPVVRTHMHGPHPTREDIWTRFLKNLGMWVLRGYGLWAVEDKASGDFAGMTGIFEVKREMTPRMDDFPEAGWTLAPRFHGRGLATEAMGAILAFTDATLADPRLYCIVASTNTASRRVAEKLGFQPSHQTPYEGVVTDVLLRIPNKPIEYR